MTIKETYSMKYFQSFFLWSYGREDRKNIQICQQSFDLTIILQDLNLLEKNLHLQHRKREFIVTFYLYEKSQKSSFMHLQNTKWDNFSRNILLLSRIYLCSPQNSYISEFHTRSAVRSAWKHPNLQFPLSRSYIW